MPKARGLNWWAQASIIHGRDMLHRKPRRERPSIRHLVLGTSHPHRICLDVDSKPGGSTKVERAVLAVISWTEPPIGKPGPKAS